MKCLQWTTKKTIEFNMLQALWIRHFMDGYAYLPKPALSNDNYFIH